MKKKRTSLLIFMHLFLQPSIDFGIPIPIRGYYFCLFCFFSVFLCLLIFSFSNCVWEVRSLSDHIVWHSGSRESRRSVVYHERLKWNSSHVKVNLPAAPAQIEITHSWLLSQKMSVCISDCSYQPLCTAVCSRHTDSKVTRGN